RFHRPPAGLGLGDEARIHIKSLRLLTDAMNVFTCEPRNDLLRDREANEAYCLAEPGRQYAVYFPDGGSVTLDVSALQGRVEMRWMDIARGAWREPLTRPGGGSLELETSDRGHWAALVTAVE
ncbi:MAG TPA: putative collagen-binding domain-containing protein, partial [Methylomirabilota bacterium]|nr:putative collagen-binding domain-containing protein [Methylomirabilota bacterium]